ncbi:MAG: hypothetical protein QM790_16030 [Nibricoccus sp.]
MDRRADGLDRVQQIARDHLLHALNRCIDLKLAQPQVDALLDAYGVAFEGRMDYEVAHAKVSVIPSTKEHLIELPSYPAFGRELRDQLIQAFTDVLGKELAADLCERLIGF